MPSWARKESYDGSSNSREQKQILADIQSGTQKFSRRLLPPRTISNKSKHGDNIVPVAAIDGTQEDRRGRKSTSSVRPGLPKRTSSMKRAYNYFFGGAQPIPAPPAPTSPLTTTDVTAPSKDDPLPQDRGVDTPPETPREARQPRLSEDEAVPPHYPLSLHSRVGLHYVPASSLLTRRLPASEPPSPQAGDSLDVQIAKLKQKLAHAEADLSEAQKVATSQDEHVRVLEDDYKVREKGFEEREATLQQDKKDLEEHMVSVVVQQHHL
ncbi:hypothetical protein T440DRAFT_152578 [Plenodomus tracheiphilus IPT5]|uniref:Uncharacterized protein n=1 Tax=Plenodomus tracheiphilus IPT5 TaxID=1408161 RepID=A0A6A7AZK7_9PLEO|nr:hypothetical protein T440DRAFT_152578 [Plenodomus tracheiphilus IPT5]